MDETIAVGPHDPLQTALRKARWRLLPLLSLCYLIAYMDRANISFAAGTMNHDLHFTPKVYGLGAGLFFLSYALMEVPSNALLLRFGAKRWLARIMLTWGLLAAAMVLVRTPRSFYVLRLLLGAAEAGYFPGAVYVLSQWFPRRERPRAVSLFYVSLPLSTIVMGAAAGALLRLDGRLGLHGWQWMFLVEAAPAVAMAVVLWFALPDSFARVRWLTVEERDALAASLRAESGKHEPGTRDIVLLRGVLGNGRVWAMSVLYFCGLGTIYAVTFSLPLLLGQATGLAAGKVGYLIAGTGVIGALLMLGGAWLSDWTGLRRPFVAGAFLLMGVFALAAGVHMHGWMAAFSLLGLMLVWYGGQGPWWLCSRHW